MDKSLIYIIRDIRTLDKPRPERRLDSLKRKLIAGKGLNRRQVRRYIRLAKELGETVPEEVTQESTIEIARQLKKPRNRKRKPVKYDAYIKSPLWNERKNKYYQMFGRQCAICGSCEFIHLHHKYYGNYGEEKDEHLVPLCKRHHEDFHTWFGKSKKNMIKMTDLFIETRKGLIVLSSHIF